MGRYPGEARGAPKAALWPTRAVRAIVRFPALVGCDTQ